LRHDRKFVKRISRPDILLLCLSCLSGSHDSLVTRTPERTWLRTCRHDTPRTFQDPLSRPLVLNPSFQTIGRGVSVPTHPVRCFAWLNRVGLCLLSEFTPGKQHRKNIQLAIHRSKPVKRNEYASLAVRRRASSFSDISKTRIFILPLHPPSFSRANDIWENHRDVSLAPFVTCILTTSRHQILVSCPPPFTTVFDWSEYAT
jgi:hypothetical protein